MLFILAVLAPARLSGEELVLAISTREVAITSTYAGAELTLFGLIERDAATAARSGSYDVLASVQGPLGDIVVQRKGSLGPIWLTAARRRFLRIPLFFSVLSARPLAEIVDNDVRRRLKLELNDHLPELPVDTVAVEHEDELGFRAALRRLRSEEGALFVDEKAVTMVRPNLFTVKIDLPATAPTGLYVVNVSVLSEGVPLKTAQSGFVVRKVGFDAFVANAARSQPLFYAAATIAMAIFLGWLANVVFRKD